MDDTYEICVIILQVILILSHVLGLYLLVSLHNDGGFDVQESLILNLSVIELVINVLYLPCWMLRLPNVNSSSLELVCAHREIITGTGLYFVYYISLFYIVINKLLEIYLNAKYSRYGNNTTAKWLIAVAWVFGIALSAGFTTAKEVTKVNVNLAIGYFHLALGITFISVATASYTYIFNRYRKSRSHPSSRNPPQSLWTDFRSSCFFISVLLVATFILLTTLPQIAILIIFHLKINLLTLRTAHQLIVVLHRISFLGDAAIYIFMHPPVRRVLMKKLRPIKRLFCRRSDEGTNSVLLSTFTSRERITTSFSGQDISYPNSPNLNRIDNV